METFTIDAAGLHFGAETLPFEDVERIVVRTTSAGPWAEDAFWCFVSRDGIREIPNGGMQDGRLEALQRHLPALDSIGIVRAMGCTTVAVFPIYDRIASRLDPADLRARFTSLVEALGGRVNGEALSALLAAWSETHRVHHGLRHLAECLDVLDRFAGRFGDTSAVELALWFHDAVYDPTRRDNEERSAAWLMEFAANSGLREPIAARAAALVRSTAYDVPTTGESREADLLHDADLAILGAEPFRFFEYERAIRKE